MTTTTAIHWLYNRTRGSPTKRKEKPHTHIRQQQGRRQHTQRQRRSRQRAAVDPGVGAVVASARRRCGLATSTGDGSTCSDDGVVERLTASGASWRRPRRRHPARQRRRRRTARRRWSAPDHSVSSPVQRRRLTTSCRLQQWSRQPVFRTQAAHSVNTI